MTNLFWTYKSYFKCIAIGIVNLVYAGKKLQRSHAKLSQRQASVGITWDQYLAPLNPPPPIHHNTIVLRGLSGTLNWGPIMPRAANLSDSWCEFFQFRIWAKFMNNLSQIFLIICPKFFNNLSQIFEYFEPNADSPPSVLIRFLWMIRNVLKRMKN